MEITPPAAVTVDTASARYDILIGAGLIDDPRSWQGLPRAAQALIVSNATVAPLYAERLRAALAPRFDKVGLIALPDGLTAADGAMLEPLGVALHTVDLAHVRPGANVAVFGSGPIGLFILPRTWGLIRQAVHILMEGVPPHLNPVEIEAAMRTAHGVRAVHDLHVWTLTSGRDALSAHVLVEDISDGQHVLGDLQALLRQRFGIEHVTIQLESDRSPLIQVGPGDVPNPQASGRTAPVTDRRPVREDHG